MNSENKSSVLAAHELKYPALNQKIGTLREGLLRSKLIIYWNYIQTDALLSLQDQRTRFPDEMVFIIDHQVNKLFFKMALYEMKQISYNFTKRLRSISCYFNRLTISFNILGDAMDVVQHKKFRNALIPASSFQSLQYRLIAFSSPDLINLINYRYRNTLYDFAFEHLYWQAVVKKYVTAKKSFLLYRFEKNIRTFCSLKEKSTIASICG